LKILKQIHTYFVLSVCAYKLSKELFYTNSNFFLYFASFFKFAKRQSLRLSELKITLFPAELPLV